jgi:integrase/recombinase XerD
LLIIQLIVDIATTGLRFFFEVTLDDRQVMRMMSTVHEPRKLPVILSPEEVKRLFDETTTLKYQAALLFEIPNMNLV